MSIIPEVFCCDYYESDYTPAPIYGHRLKSCVIGPATNLAKLDELQTC